jgi:hypothetical protein
MIENVIQVEIERRKMLLEFAKRTFPEAEVEGISIPQIEKPEEWEIAIRVKKPNYRSIIIRPKKTIMTDTKIDPLLIILAGIQEAKKILGNPPLKEEDFQGTIILGHKGVEEFLKGETAKGIYP